MASMNPKAGSVSKPGMNNTPHSYPINDVKGAYRPEDGKVIGDLGARLRVQGSAPGLDPRDPKNPNPGGGDVNTTPKQGI